MRGFNLVNAMWFGPFGYKSRYEGNQSIQIVVRQFQVSIVVRVGVHVGSHGCSASLCPSEGRRFSGLFFRELSFPSAVCEDVDLH